MRLQPLACPFACFCPSLLSVRLEALRVKVRGSSPVLWKMLQATVESESPSLAREAGHLMYLCRPCRSFGVLLHELITAEIPRRGKLRELTYAPPNAPCESRSCLPS